MFDMLEICNHVAAALYCVEAAVRIDLTNPACKRNANKWLPNRKTIEPSNIKDMDFSGEDLAREDKKRALVASPKKSFDPEKLGFKTIEYK